MNNTGRDQTTIELTTNPFPTTVPNAAEAMSPCEGLCFCLIYMFFIVAIVIILIIIIVILVDMCSG